MPLKFSRAWAPLLLSAPAPDEGGPRRLGSPVGGEGAGFRSAPGLGPVAWNTLTRHPEPVHLTRAKSGTCSFPLVIFLLQLLLLLRLQLLPFCFQPFPLVHLGAGECQAEDERLCRQDVQQEGHVLQDLREKGAVRVLSVQRSPRAHGAARAGPEQTGPCPHVADSLPPALPSRPRARQAHQCTANLTALISQSLAVRSAGRPGPPFQAAARSSRRGRARGPGEQLCSAADGVCGRRAA